EGAAKNYPLKTEIILAAKTSAIFIFDSLVHPAICGVKITLSDLSKYCIGNGRLKKSTLSNDTASYSKTSRQAPNTFLLSMLLARSFVFTHFPREVLMM